jgi:acyl carrier protein
MEYSEIIKSLNNIFCELFDDDSIIITPQMVAADLELWDSLNNIRLMVRIEEIFGIIFDTAEFTSLANVGELIKTIEGKTSR